MEIPIHIYEVRMLRYRATHGKYFQLFCSLRQIEQVLEGTGVDVAEVKARGKELLQDFWIFEVNHDAKPRPSNGLVSISNANPVPRREHIEVKPPANLGTPDGVEARRDNR